MGRVSKAKKAAREKMRKVGAIRELKRQLGEKYNPLIRSPV